VAHGDGAVAEVDDLDGMGVTARLGRLVVVVTAVDSRHGVGGDLVDLVVV
jgi:hypothetical protein